MTVTYEWMLCNYSKWIELRLLSPRGSVIKIFYLLNSMIYDRRSVDLRWLFDPVLSSSLDNFDPHWKKKRNLNIPPIDNEEDNMEPNQGVAFVSLLRLSHDLRGIVNLCLDENIQPLVFAQLSIRLLAHLNHLMWWLFFYRNEIWSSKGHF